MALANVVGMVVSIQKKTDGDDRDRYGNKLNAYGKLFQTSPEESERERCYDAKLLMLDG